MKLTIVCQDKLVSVDGVAHHGLEWGGQPELVHALQWKEASGWIEYVDSVQPNEPITELPNWALRAVDAWQVKDDEPPPLLPPVENNIETAERLLMQQDWVLDDCIINPEPDAHRLMNRNEIMAWRVNMQQQLESMTAGPVEFTPCPEPIWEKPVAAS